MGLPRTDWTLIVGATLLLTLAFPPFTVAAVAFVCHVPAALLILRGSGENRPGRRHLVQGFWYGFVTCAALLHWLAVALWRFDPWAVVLQGLVCAAFGGATAILFLAVGRVSRTTPTNLIVALPAAVVALEWATEYLGPFAFPWYRVALAVTDHPVLAQSADLLGSAGPGFLIVTVNACLALAWHSRASPRRALLRLEAAAAVLTFMTLYGLHRVATVPLDPGVRAAVVQPNVAWNEKWRPGRADEIATGAVRLAEAAIDRHEPDLVVLPETAFPGSLAEHPRWAVNAGRLAGSTRTTLLVGGLDGRTVGAGASSNALLAFGPVIGAGPEVVHRKRKLVPLLERRPSLPPIPPWAGARHAPLAEPSGIRPSGPGILTVASAGGSHTRLGALICFESTFEGMAREVRRAGADVLVVVSNDAWLGRSAGPSQHFAHAVLRAVESRVTVVRAANTGVSGIVDPLGRVVTRVEPGQPGFAVGPVQRSAPPPAVRLGGLAGPFATLLLLGMLVRSGRASERRFRLPVPPPLTPSATPPSGRLVRPVSPGPSMRPSP